MNRVLHIVLIHMHHSTCEHISNFCFEVGLEKTWLFILSHSLFLSAKSIQPLFWNLSFIGASIFQIVFFIFHLILSKANYCILNRNLVSHSKALISDYLKLFSYAERTSNEIEKTLNGTSLRWMMKDIRGSE